MATNRYCVDYAKRAGASCKKCKQKLDKGALRLGKVTPNPFSADGDDMKQWHHAACLFEMFAKARATTKKIEEPDDVEGWDVMTQEDKDLVLQLIEDMTSKAGASKKATPKKPAKGATPKTPAKAATPKASASSSKGETSRTRSPDPDKSSSSSSSSTKANDDSPKSTDSKPSNHRDNSFREFRKICAKLSEESSYLGKSGILQKFFSKGSGGGDKFQGDLYLWAKLLLPGFVKRVYNVQSKQLVHHFSQIFGTSEEDMIADLDKGDVAETINVFFEQSTKCPPATKSVIMLQEVDELLDRLAKVTKDEDQIEVLTKIAKLCTSNDLKMVIRLIKKDLRINAGAKHILEGIHPDAYQAFQVSRDLKAVINKVLKGMTENGSGGTPTLSKSLSIRASLMTPILPMLAEACKSIEQAMKKCPNGMYAEIKYDGERVQVHKQGNKFSYFSRSLKPVMPHKVRNLEDYIPQAFPHGQDIILDSEILLIDSNTGTILPFGTLGKHKKAAFPDANVCLFVFDCIHFNGENLLDKPLKDRRRIMRENMTEVPNRVMFSEMKQITKPDELKDMIMEALRKGLEGLVLKDRLGIYEPGKRHWLKVKKDYLAEGVMADSADLVVLGAFYGTGTKGGIMSIFLMGCHNPKNDTWCTVTKVSGGHDDKTLDRLQKELDMVKISKDVDKVPKWLNVTKNLIPDLVCKDPKNSQVWEIVGAEFSKSEAHTANGISIRFPRVTKIRDDKTWKEATNLQELKELFKKSKDHENLTDFLDGSGPSSSATPKKGSATSSPIKATNSPIAKGQKKMDVFVARTPEKRKANNAELESPPAKKDSTLPPYFQASTMSRKSPPTDEVLPDFFRGIRVYLAKSLPDYNLYCRHIIAYNGDVVAKHELDEVTHVIGYKKDIPEDVPKSATIVNEQWLVDSIKLQKLQNTSKYLKL